MSAKRAITAAICILFCSGLLAPPLLATGAEDGGSKLEPRLQAILDQAGADDLVPVYFVLRDQLTGPALRARAAAAGTRTERRAAVLRALKDHAAAAQSRLLKQAKAALDAGRARRLRPLWIGNIVAVDLVPREIRSLAALPEVARVRYSPKVDVSLGPKYCEMEPSPLAAWLAPAGIDAEIECGVDLMGAPLVWNDLGNTGDGAVIAVIDSGVCWSHPDIENQIWINPGEDLDGDGVVMDPDDQNGVDDDGNGYVDDLIGYDIDNGDNDPNDDNSHGSHVAGTVAGDGTGGHQSGMAPDAKVMVLRVGLQFSDEPDVWEAMQYAADNGADSISMSLGWPHNQNPDRATWRTNCENTIDAGTAMVIAAGNEGSGNEPDNVRTPGDVPRVITIGATDCSDNAASFSSRGPVTWQDVPEFGDFPWPPGLIKPDVSAPGVGTRSHNFCSGYSNKSGTSMATPHVAGAVALMVASDPGLQNDDIKLLLEESSVDLGEPGKDNTFGTGRVDAYEAVLLTATSDGRMSIRERAVSCGGTLNLVVTDADLKGTGAVEIEMTSQTEPAGEVVTLDETGPTTGVFRGSIPVGEGAPAADGTLQVADGDVATATYIDADDGMGGTSVPKTDTASIDCRSPLIGNVRDEGATLSSVTIKWDTDEPSDSLVEYGTETPPTQQEADGKLTDKHSVLLSRLTDCTVYYYQVTSVDPYGNSAVDDNGGRYYHFETLGDFGSGPQSCHAGQVTIDLGTYSCSDSVTFSVSDLDLNADSGVIETAMVEVTSSTETAGEQVLLTETGANTSTFSGSIGTAAGAPAADGVLQLSDGDVITVTYLDEDDGTGAPGLSFDTAAADCVGPKISALAVEPITDARATVSWTTDEPADTVLEWGATPALGQSISQTGLTTSHSVLLNDLASCGRVYFRASSTDEYGYSATSSMLSDPWVFDLGLIPGLYWKADFEQPLTGWTLEGEWESGAPAGQGGSSGLADPAAAYNNQGILGHDLSGLGGWPGDYEPGIAESAYTPFLDASAWTNTKLLLYRQLHAGNGDEASIWLWTGAGRPIYRSEGTVNESAWSTMSIDLAQIADGQPSLRLQFRQASDASGQYSGWSIDDVILKDGSLPDYGPCGGCGGAPAFDGAKSAADDDACAPGSVTVSWDAAVAWGSAAGGSYAVYRGEAPDFPADSAHLIASGVAGLSYTDASAPSDRQLYYLVRAESDETCAGGPANGGTVDGNEVRVAVGETSTRAVPGGVTGLVVSVFGHAHLRLSWTAEPDASVYHVYRSETPDSGFVQIGQTAGLSYDDLNVGGDRKTFYYRVRAANACGQEGP